MAAAIVDANVDEKKSSAEALLSQASYRLHQAPSWLASMIVHCIAVIVLAMLTLPEAVRTPMISVAAAVEPPLETPDVDLFVAPVDELKTENDPDRATFDYLDPGALPAGSLNDAPIEQPQFDQSDLLASTAGELGDDVGEMGRGLGRNGLGEGSAKFFTAKSTGRKFVFLVDNSTSMRNGRFETARAELIKSIDALQPHQKYCVLFFSDTSYSMLWPKPVDQLVWATTANKKELQEWLATVELCNGTKGEKAIRRAVELQPDAIFLLGDGAFADETVAVAAAINEGRIPIHALGMQVGGAGRDAFERLSTENHGTYTDVTVEKSVVEKSKANPIKANRRRGEVWGVALPK